MKRKLPVLLVLAIASAGVYTSFYQQKNAVKDELTSDQIWQQQVASKKEQRAKGYHKYDSPDEFALFQQGIRTREGEQKPRYEANYAIKALQKAKLEMKAFSASAKTTATNAITWTERGPANVPGRTRALVVLPDDATHNTWLAGSVGGGIWKTTDGGTTWVEKTKDLPNIAFTSIALAESNTQVLYAGTGEGGLGGVDLITGNGLFKSTDAGETWTQIASTAGNNDFMNISRVIVDPNDENTVLVCTSNTTDFESGIWKTTDGGQNWTNPLLTNATSRRFQQLVATPGNFNVLYATANGQGVYKSTDAGDTWSLSATGMSPSGRIEMAVSPVNTSRLFASAEGDVSGTGSDLYVSDDAGATWNLVDVSFNSTAANFLGGQGWYDNIVLCSPYDADVVYIGGVPVLKVTLSGSGTSTVTTYGVNENGSEAFMSFVNFGASAFGGALEVGSDANGTNVEFRFGPGLSQKAHRFTVPAGQGSGVPDANYTYQDYVDVPFEVWDTDNNQQLMVSFRDQQVDGVFNLIEQNTDGDASTHSREYIYVNNVAYNATTPDANIATAGGHVFKQMYFFWPVLTPGATWDAAGLPASTLAITATNVTVNDATTQAAADPYGDYDGTNAFNNFGVDVHPDQHGIVAIKEDAANKTFRILLSNDGGPFISKTSTDPGVTQGDWTMVGNTYNTGQFYGADKKPGADAYFGGMQDNGTWQSDDNADATTAYNFRIGGDGFEALWNNNDANLLIGGSQNNGFRRSTNGGASFTSATSGLTGSHPFISKLANSKKLPDVIYTVSSDGVFKSEDFGGSWQKTAITSQWGGASTFLDVEVSRANPNIVWAGSGISNVSDRRIFVSTDQAASFTATAFTDLSSGTITKLASHPTEPNTAYVLFSQAQRPKILRTTDLGQTWEDISGFNSNTVSSNGFPDVAVYCLYVFADNPDKIWAGTDIGIVESLDNGASWQLLVHDMPRVAVWDMKGQDNQIVIATHGRGIWTATVDNDQTAFKQGPDITFAGTSPQRDFLLKFDVAEAYDSVEVYIDNVNQKTIYNVGVGEATVSIPNISSGSKKVKLVSYIANLPVFSDDQTLEHLSLGSTTETMMEFMESSANFSLGNFMITPFTPTGNMALQTAHDYSNNSNDKAILTVPIKVSGTNSNIYYEDIAVIEPGDAGSVFGDATFNDYVVVEATKDGLSWLPLADGYDASDNANWKDAFDNGSSALDGSYYVSHTLDLRSKFNVGDTVLVRFRMFSNAQNTGWGWAIDNLYIQTEPLGIEKASEITGYNIYPIPSNGNVTIDYNLTTSSEVVLDIMTVAGQKVKSYNLGKKATGNYRLKLSELTLENGLYIFALKTNSGITTKRVIMNR